MAFLGLTTSINIHTVGYLAITFTTVLLRAMEDTNWTSRDIGRQKIEEQLTNTLGAIEKTLDFMEGSLSRINLDGIFGIRLVDDQFHVLLHQRRRSLGSDHSLRSITSKLQHIQRRGEHIADLAMYYVKKLQPVYFRKLDKMLRKGRWRFNYPARYTRTELRETPAFPTSYFSEYQSDKCIEELLRSKTSNSKHCDISKRCWNIMTSHGTHKYTLTHEALYLEIGEMSGCKNHMTLLAERFNQGNFSHLLDVFCANILRDVELIESDGFPLMWRDLFLEQVAVCGLVGYKDFCRPEWVDLILSWQLPSGCYGSTDSDGIEEISEKNMQKRTKREEMYMGGGCFAHTTSMALGALVVNTRFLVEELMTYS
ncbi:UPF0764 protein C16orf89 homolog isoform X1 [Tachypleus tridentatus]|uniref:UPF0764 protein C16orf89 homolog isoform X1 n=1 Tax=Tachypleus tridentatus TaxID=6853 RepID=UPI003FD0C56A